MLSCPRVRICPLNHHHTGQFAVDRAAATRFIKHAIAQAKDMPSAPTSDSGPTTTREPSNTNGLDIAPVLVPVKVTEKMLEREQYQRELREEEREEEDSGDLKVIDGEEDDDGERSSDNSPSQASGATKGKSKVPSEKSIGKRRRRPIDPFAGLCTFIQSLYNLTVTFPPACLPRLWRGSPFRRGR